MAKSGAVEDLDAPLEAVAHIGLDEYAYLAVGGFHHLLHAHAHERHPRVERTSEAVAAPVGVGGEEL